MKTRLLTLIASTAFAGAALAAAAFDFKIPGRRPTPSSNSMLRSKYNGSASISGTVTFDPADPGATRTGAVDARSIVLSMMMNIFMGSNEWTWPSSAIPFE